MPLITYRCFAEDCRAVLFEADIKEGTIHKKCPKCKLLNVIEVKPEPAARLVNGTKPFQERLNLNKK